MKNILINKKVPRYFNKRSVLRTNCDCSFSNKKLRCQDKQKKIMYNNLIRHVVVPL